MANLTEELMDALGRLLRHEPWPPSVQSERDYLYASEVLVKAQHAQLRERGLRKATGDVE